MSNVCHFVFTINTNNRFAFKVVNARLNTISFGMCMNKFLSMKGECKVQYNLIWHVHQCVFKYLLLTIDLISYYLLKIFLKHCEFEFNFQGLELSRSSSSSKLYAWDKTWVGETTIGWFFHVDVWSITCIRLAIVFTMLCWVWFMYASCLSNISLWNFWSFFSICKFIKWMWSIHRSFRSSFYCNHQTLKVESFLQTHVLPICHPCVVSPCVQSFDGAEDLGLKKPPLLLDLRAWDF